MAQIVKEFVVEEETGFDAVQLNFSSYLNNDGQISPEDRTVLGQTAPKYRWGINNQFNYKNWSLSVFVNAMTGWEAQFNLLDISTQTGNSYPGRSVNFLNAGYWTPENQSIERPGLTYTKIGRAHV